MADRDQPQHEEAPSDQRSPITHDLDADGMDSESEADEIEAGGIPGHNDEFDRDGDVERHGIRQTPDKK